MNCRDIESMTDEEFRELVAQHEAEWDAKQGQQEAEDAARCARVKREREAERARCEAEGRWYDSPKTRPKLPPLLPEFEAGFAVPESALRGGASCPRAPTTPPVDAPAFLRYPNVEGWSPQLPQGAFTMAQASPHPLLKESPVKDKANLCDRLGQTPRRLFDEDESEDDLAAAADEGGEFEDEFDGEFEGEEGEVDDDALNTTHVVTMEDVLSKMTAAQARRRYAPSWAFIAWEVDRAWFATCLASFFEQQRWPAASRVPAAVRAVCRDSGVGLHELYVQEAFAPKYVAVARAVDQEWFDWLVDEFFSAGSWPRFDELPEGIRAACAQAGVRPNDLV